MENLMEIVIVENQIISLTAQIVSAHVANNDVTTDQLSAFIRGVHLALTTAGQNEVDAVRAAPAVAIKKSVFTDHILCLDCGESFKMLKRHISTEHQMTPTEYRTKWGLPLSYSMVASDYAATRSKLAKDSGLGRKPEEVPPLRIRGRSKRK